MYKCVLLCFCPCDMAMNVAEQSGGTGSSCTQPSTYNRVFRNMMEGEAHPARAPIKRNHHGSIDTHTKRQEATEDKIAYTPEDQILIELPTSARSTGSHRLTSGGVTVIPRAARLTVKANGVIVVPSLGAVADPVSGPARPWDFLLLKSIWLRPGRVGGLRTAPAVMLMRTGSRRQAMQA